MAPDQRSPLVPAVPTAREIGLPDYKAYSWYGVSGPAGLPRETVTRMAAAVEQALADPAIQARFEQMGTPAMIRIRRIAAAARIDRDAIEAAVRLLRDAFPAVRAGEFGTLPALLRHGGPDKVRPFLLVAEDGLGRVRGAAILWHMPDICVLWLDYIAGTARAVPVSAGRSIGARELAAGLNAAVPPCECLTDDPNVVADPALRAANARRLRFYARFGARPLAGTDYELPIPGGTGPMPLLVVDLLDRRDAWPRDETQAAIRAVLTRKYGCVCPPA